MLPHPDGKKIVGFLFISSVIVCLRVCICSTDVPGAHRRAKRGIRAPATGFSNNCELPCGCREQNTGSMQEQQIARSGALVRSPSTEEAEASTLL